ncbi:MAG: TonB-dependent siderophore receptor [Sphingobium sp.]
MNFWGLGATAFQRLGARTGAALLMASSALAFPLSALAFPLLTDPAQAQEQGATAFNIPSQDLGEAVTVFGQQARIQVTAGTGLLIGKRSAAVSGRFSPAEALSRLLAGAGVTFRWIDRNTIALEPAPQAADGAIQLGPVRVEGAGIGRIAVGDIPSEGTGSYTVPQLSLMKGASSPQEIPQSVSVITRQQIEDQALTTLTDVLDKTTGVTVVRKGTLSGISHGNDSSFSSRGFELSNVQLDGGAPMSSDMSGFGSVSQLDMAQFDRVEFMRGVDGLFSGTGEPGGTVNLVRKRPSGERHVNLSVSAASWNNYRAEADIGGPLTDDGRLRGRFGVAHEDREYFYDIAQTRKSVAYGSIEADLDENTLLTLGGSYQTSKGTLSVGGLPRYSNGADIHLPRGTALTTDWSKSKEKATSAFAKIERKLGEDWLLSADALYLNIERDAKIAYALGAIDPDTGDGARWYSYPADSGMKRIVANLNVKGSIDALGQKHDIIIGADYSKGKSSGIQWRDLISGTEFDIFDITRPQQAGLVPMKDDHRTMERHALYGSLRLGVTDAFKLIAGGRYSFYSFETHNTQWNSDGTVALVQGLGTVKTNGVFTPYAAATLAIDSRWNAYASYAETYLPQDTSLRGPLPGTPLDPVESKNYEVGIKGGLMDGRLNTSLALYRIERTGEAVEDPAYEMQWGISTCCYFNRGKVVSQGVDVEVSGEIVRGLEISAGYTFNDNEDKEAENARYSSTTPRHLFKVWTAYRLPGSLSKWRIGGGVTAQSAIFVRGTASTYNPDSGKWDGDDVDFDFKQGGYSLWSARVDYSINDNWSAALNINNIFDKKYYQTVGYNYFGNFYGDPRNWSLTLRGKF